MATSKKRRKPAPREDGWRKKQMSNRKALAWVLAVPAAGFGLYAVLNLDAGGKAESVTAQVVSTSTYDHTTPEGTHQHTAAEIEVEGVRTTLQPADGAAPGGTLPVKITRGRLTGRISVLGLDRPEAPPSVASPFPPPEL